MGDRNMSTVFSITDEVADVLKSGRISGKTFLIFKK